MKVLGRGEGGADPALPRKGHLIGASRRTEVINGPIDMETRSESTPGPGTAVVRG